MSANVPLTLGIDCVKVIVFFRKCHSVASNNFVLIILTLDNIYN